MSRLFDSYIAVHWSAASKPNQGNDSVWIAALMPDARMKLQKTSINPKTRAEAKDQLVAAISRLMARGDKIFLGLGFPLGFPHGTVSALGLSSDQKPDWQVMHEFVTNQMKDKADNTNNRFSLAARMNRLISEGPFPYWGCPKKDELTTLPVKKTREHKSDDLPEFRLTEKSSPVSSSSVWKLSYGNATGGLALTGIPLLASLREQFGDKMNLWPYDTGFNRPDQNEIQLIVAEVSPESQAKAVQSGNNKTQIVTESLIESISDRDLRGKLSAEFEQPARDLDQETLEKSLNEGWILGK